MTDTHTPETHAPGTVDETVVGAVAAPEAEAVDAHKTLVVQVEKIAKSIEGAATFNKESLDAFAASGAIAMKSAEEIAAELVAWSRKSMEASVAAARGIAGAKSVNELMERQTDFAKAAFDGMVQQMTRMSELTLTASRQAMEPLNARVAAAAEMVRARAA